MRLFIYYYSYLIFFGMATEWKDECDDLPGSVTPQASMKLGPPHRSPALPRRGPPHHHSCPPHCLHCSPPPLCRCSVRAAGTAGAAGTFDSPAQGG